MDEHFFNFDSIASFQKTPDTLNVESENYYSIMHHTQFDEALNELAAFESSIDGTHNSVSMKNSNMFNTTGALSIIPSDDTSEHLTELLNVISSPSQSSTNMSSTEYTESSTPASNSMFDESMSYVGASATAPTISFLLPSTAMNNMQSVQLNFEQCRQPLTTETKAVRIRPNGNIVENYDTKKRDQYYGSAISKANEIDTVSNRRKPSHNIIEKRYRTSINDKILELKKIVMSGDEKIQKSAILRRTIEYIRELQSTNARLQEENGTLKSVLKRLNVTTNGQSSNSSDVDEQLSSANEISNKRSKRNSSKRGMVNGSRLILCCFMICILIGNPFDSFLERLHGSNKNEASDGIQSIIQSRTLKATNHLEASESSMFFSSSWKKVIGWMLNLAICFLCLVKIFVHGDPIVDASEMNEYLKVKRQADQRAHQRQFKEARHLYYKACEKLYYEKSRTIIARTLSIIWQIIRLILNILFIGRWLTYWSGWTKSIDTRFYHLELNDCFLQLWKLNYKRKSSIFEIVDIALLAMNSGIASGKLLARSKKNEMILLMGLTLDKINWFPSIFIIQILKGFKPTEMRELCFLDADRFYRFIRKNNVDLFHKESIIDSIRYQYLDEIFKEEMINQILFQDQIDVPLENKQNFDEYSWWYHCLRVSRLLNSHEENSQSKPKIDMSVYEISKTIKSIDQRYIFIVETMHRLILFINEHLELCNEKRIFLLTKLGKISEVLTSIDHQNRALIMAVHALLFDNILSLRLRLLTCSVEFNDPTNLELEQFQSELNHYKTLIISLKIAQQRFRLFESIHRALTGLNPLRIQTVFESSLKQIDENLQKHDKYQPNSEVIAAMLVFCYLSPTAIFRYRSTFQQVLTLSKATETNRQLCRLKQQYQMIMRQPYLTL